MKGCMCRWWDGFWEEEGHVWIYHQPVRHIMHMIIGTDDLSSYAELVFQEPRKHRPRGHSLARVHDHGLIDWLKMVKDQTFYMDHRLLEIQFCIFSSIPAERQRRLDIFHVTTLWVTENLFRINTNFDVKEDLNLGMWPCSQEKVKSAWNSHNFFSLESFKKTNTSHIRTSNFKRAPIISID